MSIRVEAPGLLTTLQDLGRFGYQHLGVGTSGAMDPVSHRIANLLAGNPPGAAALEITLAGPRLRFDDDALVAVCGGDFNPRVEGLPVRLVAAGAGAGRGAAGVRRGGPGRPVLPGRGRRVPGPGGAGQRQHQLKAGSAATRAGR